MKFKVGDEVRVREDLEVNKIYNDFIFVPDMKKQKSKIVKITQVSDNTNSYRIMEDLERYFWTDEMLEPIENDKIDWNNNNLPKWFLCNWQNNIGIGSLWVRYPNIIYFSSEEIAEKALKKFGARLKELYIDAENNLKDSE